MQVEAESEQSTPNLYCQAAQELRNIGSMSTFLSHDDLPVCLVVIFMYYLLVLHWWDASI